jgi:hypothetical protein
MASLKQRKISKNEATGMRLVSQFVQEFWECGWQSFEHRNDKGIDGLIILRKRGEEVGVRINVQVKCGGSYVSSHDEKFIKFRFKSKGDLEKHLSYWKKQIEPCILVLINPGAKLSGKKDDEIDSDLDTTFQNRLNPEAYWVDLKDEGIKVSDTETLIYIPKKQKFGQHSKGDILKLCNHLIPKVTYPNLLLEDYAVSLIKNEITPRQFYNNWKSVNNGIMFCPALNDNIIISNTGWKHITSKGRGKERRSFSLTHLGTAKQIISQVGLFKTIHKQSIDENDSYKEYRLGLLANVKSRQIDYGLIQVILNVREDKTTNQKKYWFYSVHQKKVK